MAEGNGRQLRNWLKGFLDWTMPRSETPESMLKWMGLFTLSSLVKRNVHWPKALMGSYSIYPNFYIVLVGEPAVVRKSTTVDFAKELLGNAPVTFAGDVSSHSKILDALVQSPDASLSIVSSEFSSLIQTTPEATYELLTDIFDNKASFSWSTWAHGDKKVEKPVVNLAAATTPAWMSRQPHEYFVGGGFSSRVLFLYEEEPRQKEIYYDHLDQQYLTDLERSLIEDLNAIGKITGEVRHDSNKTKEHIRGWYKKQVIENPDPKLKGYFGRKHVHAHKIATLLSLAEGDNLKITMKHWKEALIMLAYVEGKMSKAFAGMGTNPFANMMEEIVDYLRLRDDETSFKQIAQRFYSSGVTLEQLKAGLAYLCTAGKIKAKGIENPVYTAVKLK